MSTLAKDLSNYTVALTPELLEGWKAQGFTHAIIQAVDPPPGYPAGRTREQIQQCLDAGLTVDAYVWLWFALGVADIQRKLSLLDGLPIRQIWLDVEDQAAADYDQATVEAKIRDALNVCDSHPSTGRARAGVYSGRWWWADPRYGGNTTAFSDRLLWDSDYDGVADTEYGWSPYGGWQSRAIKQFEGTQPDGTDLNVLSAAEAERLNGGGDVTDPEREAMQDQINGLVSSLGLIAGDLLAPVLPQKTSTKAVRRLVAGIMAEADAHGIAHA
jgi:hypothetical protein